MSPFIIFAHSTNGLLKPMMSGVSTHTLPISTKCVWWMTRPARKMTLSHPSLLPQIRKKRVRHPRNCPLFGSTTHFRWHAMCRIHPIQRSSHRCARTCENSSRPLSSPSMKRHVSSRTPSGAISCRSTACGTKKRTRLTLPQKQYAYALQQDGPTRLVLNRGRRLASSIA